MFDKSSNYSRNNLTKGIIYPLISTGLFIVLAVLLFFTARFLYRNINRVFYIDENALEAQLIKIDVDGINRVIDRLNISTQSSEEAEKENSEASDAGSSTEEELEENTSQKVDISTIRINVLNVGATSGQAGKIKDLLIEKGYETAESGDGVKRSFTGSEITYEKDEFKEESENIKKLLDEAGVKTEVVKAETEEEKSGDVVVLLGK